METFRSRPGTRKANKKNAKYTCETEGCDLNAGYICKSHGMKLICEECMDQSHKDCYIIDYRTSKDLKKQIDKTTAMVKHIVTDCGKFKEKESAAKILKEVSKYQEKVKKLNKKATECINSNPEEYREKSLHLFKKAHNIEIEIQKSYWFINWYSKQFIKYHVADKTILYAEEEKIDNDMLLEAEQLMNESFYSSASNLTERTNERELKTIIEQKDRELEEHKKKIAELIEYAKKLKKQISKLKQKSKEPSVDEAKSEHKELEHEDSENVNSKSKEPQKFINRDELQSKLSIEYGTINNSDGLSEVSHVTKKSHPQSESNVTVTADEAAGVADLFKKSMDDIDSKEAEFNRIMQEKDHQNSELKQQVDDLLNAIQAREDKILGLQQKLQETSADETKSEHNESEGENSKDIDLREYIHRGKLPRCLSIEYDTIIDLIETEDNVSTFISNLAQHFSQVKQQLDQRMDYEDYEDDEDDEDNSLTIDMRKEDDIKFVNILKYFRLPKLYMINLKNLDENNSDILNLMTNSFPHQLSEFIFNYDSDKMINIDYYMTALLKYIPNVTFSVYINNCEMNTSQFSTLIKTASHIKHVWIRICKINGDDEFDFTIDQPYNIKELSLWGTGYKDRSDWSVNKEQFINILKAISNSTLKHSLKGIGIKYCQITEEGQTYLDELGLNHIEVYVGNIFNKLV